MNLISSQSPYHLPSSSPEHRHVISSKQQLQHDLTRVRKAWSAYQSSNDRDRAYRFLRVVFGLVHQWREAKRSQAFARRLLKLIDAPPYLALEPHSILILAGAGPDLDHRCRSTWSRALRVAARHDVPPTKLISFLRRKGGLNKCAAALSRQRKRAAPHLNESHVVPG
jgi:hypothetical protein